jgi:hypothetical protein
MATRSRLRGRGSDAPVRLIKIAAQDAKGRHAYPVNIEILLDGIKAGSLTTDRDHASPSIAINDLSASVQLYAWYGGHELFADLSTSLASYLFEFPIVAREDFAGPSAEARCPDGTTGVPCVTCTVNGTKVRICV